MKTPFFSIIIPAYNAEKTIASSINSILEQNYDNCEVIVVDDGSKDSTTKKVKAIASDKVKFFHKENGGVSSARNYGLKKATGDWIIFLDADDTLTAKSLEKLAGVIKEKDADYIMTPLKTRKHIAKNMHVPREKAAYVDKTDAINGLIFNLSSSPYYYQRGIGGKIISRKLIEKHRLSFDERLKVFEDGIFNLFALSHSEKVLFYNTNFYDYDLKNNNSRSNTFYPGIIEDNEIIFETIKQILEEMKYESPSFPYLRLELFHNSSLAVSRKPVKNAQKIKELKQLNALYVKSCIGRIKFREVYKCLRVAYIFCRIKAYSLLLLFYKQYFKLLRRRGRV